jgi:hypothetical protein
LPKVGAFFKPTLPTDQMIERQLRALGEPPRFATTAAEAQRLHDEIGAKARAAGFADSSPCGKVF